MSDEIDEELNPEASSEDESFVAAIKNNLTLRLGGDILFFYYDEERGAIAVTDQGGFILRRDEFLELVGELQAWYALLTDEEIELHNQAREMRINPPPREVKQKRPRKLRPGQIYLIRSDNGFYKIGRSANAVARFKNLTVQLPYKLELLLVIETDDTVRLEKELHERFHHCRSRGEWFALSDEDVEWIKSYSATSELG